MLGGHFWNRSASGKSRYPVIWPWITVAVLCVMAVPAWPASSLTSTWSPQDGYAMQPDAGPRGTQVAVTGPVASGNAVAVFWDDTVIASCDPAPRRCQDPANQDPRRFLVTFTVPPEATAGQHRVTLCASGFCEGYDGAWTFTVEHTAPTIESVRPRRTVPGRPVTVEGNTGSCNRRATISLPELPGVSKPVTGGERGDFLARLQVPRATTPGTYKLELTVVCGTVTQLAVDELIVKSPTPVKRPPIILPVPPTPANGQATVRGNTGSCNRRATLAVDGMAIRDVDLTGDPNGNVATTLTVPKATLPETYPLELRVDCHGETQRAPGELVVENHAPVAADDTATTAQGTPVTIAVTANDRDPDGDDGYPTLLFEQRPPSYGTTDMRPDGSIEYAPDPGFVGKDDFQYRNCDDTRGAAGQDPDAWLRSSCGTATVTVTVIGRTPPSISPVPPTPPNRQVTVGGTTGSCTTRATLAVHGMPIPDVGVTGDPNGKFSTTVTVPKAVLPGTYELELRVDCHGATQRAHRKLSVENRGPVAADDVATTAQDTPVTVAVTANDTDPDGDDGYPTLVFERKPPSYGTTEIRPDGGIVYTPDQGFAGKDHFEYRNCDNIPLALGQDLDAWMRSACGAATVTVTVNPVTTTSSSTTTSVTGPTVTGPTSTTTGGSSTGVPSTSGPSTTTTTRPDCVPAPGDVRSFQVTPVKGRRGAELRIAAKTDSRLAACPVNLLLGGSPLGGGSVIQPDGAISERLPVPSDAKLGASTVSLAATDGQILAEAPFEILSKARPWWQGDRFRLLVAGGAFLVGFLGRAAFRRLRAGSERSARQRRPTPPHVRAEPHPGPAHLALTKDTSGPPTFSIRLRPHEVAGTQTLEEVAA